MANPVGTIIAEALSDKLSPLEAASLAVELDAMQRITAKVGGREAKFDKIEAISGRFSTLPHEFGQIGSSSVPAQTIGNDSLTTVNVMTATQISQGLSIDSAGEYVGIGQGTPADSVYLISAYARFASNPTGFREINIQFFDSVAGTWGNGFVPVSLPANPDEVTNLTGVVQYSTNPVSQLTRVRFQVKQNSGGDLAIDIPQLMVTRLR